MPYAALPVPLLSMVWILDVLLIVEALRRADSPARGDRLVWVVTTGLVLLARQMTVTTQGEISLQFVGAAWLALLLGYPRTVVSMTVIVLVETLQNERALLPQGVSLLLLGIAPAWLIWWFTRACRRWLPANLFVFLIGPGFLGLFAACAVSLLASASVATLALVGDESGQQFGRAMSLIWRHALPYAMLLAAGEAWLEGMMTTLLVVFAPERVRLFDENHYLARR